MKKLLLLPLAMLFSLASLVAQPKVERVNPWPMKELMKTPKYTIEDGENGVKKIIYESVDYRGAKKKTFAYYSTPGILKGNPKLDKNLPAVVCVHGGGGQAFEEWVKIWAEKGYAAISMGTEGKRENKSPLKGGYDKKKGSYCATVEDQKEDWFYNAVIDVVAAHSLILSFKEVDAKRTAVTGVSWGGILTTLVSGLDPRFKVAVPVYGCGYLYQTGSMAPQIKVGGARTIKRWRTMYDPALWVKDAKIPVLFVDGTNDHHFYLNQWTETAKLAKNHEFSARVGLKHGHGPAWKLPEIYSYIGYHLGVDKAPASAKFSNLVLKGKTYSCTVSDAPKGTKAFLNYALVPEVGEKTPWATKPAKLDKNKITAEITPDMKQWYFSVELPGKECYSSEIHFLEGNKLW